MGILEKGISECGIEEVAMAYQTSEPSSPRIQNEFAHESPEVEMGDGNNTFQTSANAFDKAVP